MRKTLIGALASFLLLTAFSATAVAQDDTTATTTPVPTETATAVPTETTTAVPTETTEAADSTAGLAGAPTGEEDSGIGEAFAVDTPNPQPSVPLTPTSPDDAAAATDPAAAGAADATAAPAAGAEAAVAQDTAQNQLAFTGPDTRVAAVAFTLLGLGAAFTAASRRRDDA